MGNIYTGSNTGKAGLEVTEADGTPDVFGVSKIIVSNGTLTDNNDGSVTIQTGGGGGGGGSVTSVDVSGGSTGLTTSGGPITGAGTITISGVLETANGGTGLSSIGTANQFLRVNSLGTALEYATVNTVLGSGSANQVAVFSSSDTVGSSAGLTYTVSGSDEIFQVSGNEPKIIAKDDTSNAVIVLDPSVPDGTGGVAMTWGIASSPELYLKIGAFSGANNMETKNRDFRFFGDTGNLITMDESALNTAIGGVFGLNNGSDPLPLPTRTLDVGKEDSSTNTVLNILGLTRQSSNNPAVGIGVGMDFVVETSDGNNEIGATIEAITTNVGSTTEAFDFTFNLMAGGATAAEKMRIASTGAITFNQAYTFPVADGNTNDVLITDGAGNLSFSNVGYSNWRASDGSNIDEVNSGDTLTFTGGTGITTTLSGTGGTTPNLTIDVDTAVIPSGTGVANQVTYWSGANTIAGDTGLTYNSTPGSRRLSIEDSSTGTMFEVKSTDGGGGSAPDVVFVRDSSSPVAGDDLGVIVFKGNDSGGAEQEFARISAEANTVTAGSEDGQLDFRVFQAGSLVFPMRVTESGVFVNVANNPNLDFVVDTQSQDFAFQVDSSQDDIRTQVPFRDEIEIQSTDGGATVAPDLKLYRNSPSPAANDVLGQVLFSGEDDASQKINYASITGFAVDVASAQPDGAIVFNCLRNGTSAPYFDIGKLVSGVRAMTVNPNALDNDFYIKTVNQSEAFKMDGSADTATFNVPVTIIVDDLDGALTVESTDSTTGTNSSPDIFVKSAKSADGDYLGAIYFQGQNSVAANTSYAKILSRIDTATDGDEAGVLFTSIPHQGTDRTFSYFEGGNGTSNGRVSFNYNAKDIDFGVLNQGTADGGPGGFALFAQAETGEVGINTSSPSATLHIKIPTVASNTQGLMIESEDDGSSVGPQLILLRDSATPAVSDDIGQIRFQGKNLSATTVTYSDIYTDILDPTASSEDGRVFFRCVSNSTLSNYLTVAGTGSGQISTNFPLDIQGGLTAYEGVAPADGQLLIGDTAGGKFDMATLTSTGGTVTITNGAGTINLEAAGGGGGTPAGANTEIQFNNSGAFGASSNFTFNSATSQLTLTGPLSQTTADTTVFPPTEGGNIISNDSTVEMALNAGVVQQQEIGLKQTAAAHQVELGKTTTQSFGQTQNLNLPAGPTDCYPSQGGLIVCDDNGGSATQTINLACMIDTLGAYSPNANPPNVAGGGTPVAGIPDKSGYGTWQIGDQVTVVTRFTGGGTPNITILSYAGVDNGTGGSSDPQNIPAPLNQQIPINGVVTGTTITSNYSAKTFILTQDLTNSTQVSWVAIG